jgi:hypothetical protein
LPSDNGNFNSIALALAEKVRARSSGRTTKSKIAGMSSSKERTRLAKQVAAKELHAQAVLLRTETNGSTQFRSWKVNLGEWNVPVLEVRSATAAPEAPILVIADQGRARLGGEVAGWIREGKRIFLLDSFYFGESKISTHAHLFALLVAATGERPLGIQASQVAGVARWIAREAGQNPEVRAVGPRTSLVALVAGALEPRAISALDLRGSLPSLHTVLQKNWGVNQAPELFCFGLLEDFDIPALTRMISPRRLLKTESSDLLK